MDPADRLYVVSVPELPGCHAHGATHGEAARKGHAPIRDGLEASHAGGQPFPPRHW
jgi:predicted RNase H-like HicB family nuclease